MPYRKIFVNLLAAFVIFPLFLSVKYWKNIVNGQYRYYDAYYEKLTDYIYVTVIHSIGYPIMPIFVLIFIFLPFQLLKDYYSKQRKRLSILKKILILSILVLGLIVLFGTFSNIWTLPIYKNLIYLVYSLAFGGFFAWLLYALIDRYEERLPESMR